MAGSQGLAPVDVRGKINKHKWKTLEGLFDHSVWWRKSLYGLARKLCKQS